MADHDVLDWDPYSLPIELLQAIGLVNACFAQSEEILQDAIAGCAGLDYEYGLAFTTHMTMPLRFDVLRSVAEIRIDDLDILDELDDLLTRFETAIQKRNAIAHQRWCLDPTTGETFTSKHSARGSVRTELIPTSIEQVIADAEFIYGAGMGIFEFLGLHNLLAPVAARPSRHHKSKAARKKRREGKL